MWHDYLMRGGHTERYGHLVQGLARYAHSARNNKQRTSSAYPLLKTQIKSCVSKKTDPTGSASTFINTSASLGTTIAAAGIAGKGKYPEFG